MSINIEIHFVSELLYCPRIFLKIAFVDIAAYFASKTQFKAINQSTKKSQRHHLTQNTHYLTHNTQDTIHNTEYTKPIT